MPQAVAAGCRIYDEFCSDGVWSFMGKGPLNTTCAARVLLPSEPSEVLADGQKSGEWDPLSHTCLLRFENRPEGVRVIIRY